MPEKFEGDEIRHSTLYVQVHERKAVGEAYVSTLTDVDEASFPNPTTNSTGPSSTPMPRARAPRCTTAPTAVASGSMK